MTSLSDLPYQPVWDNRFSSSFLFDPDLRERRRLASSRSRTRRSPPDIPDINIIFILWQQLIKANPFFVWQFRFSNLLNDLAFWMLYQLKLKPEQCLFEVCPTAGRPISVWPPSFQPGNYKKWKCQIFDYSSENNHFIEMVCVWTDFPSMDLLAQKNQFTFV